MKELKAFVKFINERWAIHTLRSIGAPPPWTKDPILAKYRFCNVRREDDRVTKWIYQRWLQPHAGDPNVWFAMVVARMVNWPPSLEAVQPAVFAAKGEGVVKWEPKLFVKLMNNRKVRGEKVFTSAYMIRAIEAKDGETKADYLAQHVFRHLWDQRKTVDLRSLRDFHNWLMPFYGMGSFLAAQVVADAKWSGPLLSAHDWATFAAPGPGSLRGMSRVEWGDLGTTYTDTEWRDSLSELRKRLLPRLSPQLRDLDAQNIQNCLCEFDKYCRAKNGEGRPRQNFKPSEEAYV